MLLGIKRGGASEKSKRQHLGDHTLPHSEKISAFQNNSNGAANDQPTQQFGGLIARMESNVPATTSRANASQIAAATGLAVQRALNHTEPSAIILARRMWSSCLGLV
jgi:hypothetical protein